MISDQSTPLGIATSRTEERLMASLGLLTEAPLAFERCEDVPQGGVICALPALVAVGLLRHVREFFTWAKGFYPMESIFLALAFMALARVRSLEALRYEPPGEWGKLLGLDRIPEVRTMRQKIASLSEQQSGQATAWSSQLAQDWMAQMNEHAGFYYVDGHVRPYYGYAANRPKTYVAREQLCLRATLDYWVNAMDGQPFFVLTQPLNELLVKTLREEIIPRLKREVPDQPTQEQLEANPLLHRFVVIFDREGYSPKEFEDLEEQRIAVISYAKRCKATQDWPLEEFSPQSVTLINGQTVELSMAERGICLSNGHWLREIRVRDEGGEQIGILSTDYIHPMEKVAAVLYARWCQENFFRYMLEHYSLDRLVQYGAQEIPETAEVVNPARRVLENQIRTQSGQLTRQRALLAASRFPSEPSASKAAAFEQKQGKLLEEIKQCQEKIAELKAQRKDMPRHVPMKELPVDQRFTALRSESKHFIDTIKMIAYRAETALLAVARPHLRRQEDARSWIQQVLQSSVNLVPDTSARTLTVQVHPLTSPIHNEALKELCQQLTDTETIYPRTDLRLVFEFLGPS